MRLFNRKKPFNPSGYDYLQVAPVGVELIDVGVKLLHPDAVVPEYAHDGDSGFDIIAIHDAFISPGFTVVVNTGLAFELPAGYEIQARPRSGNSSRTKLRIANSPGTVDSIYRGEVGIIIDNIDDRLHGQPIEIKKGDRIAQGVLQRVPKARFTVKTELSTTDRGEGAYGSTGGGING